MKRGLFVLFFGITFFVLLFPNLGILKTSAQTNPPLTYEQIKQRLITIGSDQFDKPIKRYQDLVSQYGLSTDAGKDAAAILQIIRSSKSFFLQKYANDSRITSVDSAYSLYRIAMNDAASQATQAYSQLPQERQNGTVRSAVDIFASDIKSAADDSGLPSTVMTLTSFSQTSVNASTDAAATKIESEKTSKCGFWKWSIIDCIDEFVTWFIKTTLLQFAGIFVYLGASLLHYSIYLGVFNFSEIANSGLYPLWQVLKDIFNLAILFFGLGVIIMYLINKGDNIKQFVPWIILYAIFVNFSWTATRTVVDYSNILTLKMYQIVAPNALSSNTFTMSINDSPGTIIMNQLGLQTIIQKINDVKTGNTATVDAIQSTPVALLFVLMMFYVALLFFIASIIFAARTFFLVLFIIGAPILLIDSVLPWIGEHVKKARMLFFSQLAVGFVFMFLFAIIVKIMSLDIFKTGPASVVGGQIINGVNDSNTKMFFGILITLLMLHFLMKLTLNMSKGVVGNVLNSAVGVGLTALSGGTAMIARSTLGAGAAALARSSSLDRMQGSRIGRGVMSAATGLANSSFDIRNLPRVQQGLKSSGIPLYSPAVSYEQQRKTTAERVQTTAQGIQNSRARSEYLNQIQGGRLKNMLGRNSIGRNAVAEYQKNVEERLLDYDKTTNKKGERQRKYAQYKDLRGAMLERDQEIALQENAAKNNSSNSSATNTQTTNENKKGGFDFNRNELEDYLKGTKDIKGGLDAIRLAIEKKGNTNIKVENNVPGGVLPVNETNDNKEEIRNGVKNNSASLEDLNKKLLGYMGNPSASI